MTVEFVDENRAEFGVGPVCAALQVAPSTYWSTKRRPPSERSKRDALMMPLLLALWQANYSVYGARKLWIAARRSWHDIGRGQVARLMGRLGIRGVKRTKKVRTTRPARRRHLAPILLDLPLPLPHRPHLTPPQSRCCDDRLNPPSSPASDTASASTRSAPSPRSDRSGTHMTTPWPRP